MVADVSSIENEPVEVVDGVFWVGAKDDNRGLLNNPYLILDQDRSLVLDSGSRTEFVQIMMQILKTGIKPEDIEALIYHHYDPDLCSNIPHMEEIIGRDDLKLISQKENNVFIHHFGIKSQLYCIEELGMELKLGNHHFLFSRTPYAHTIGSFVSYDLRNGCLFSSDIFGAFDSGQDLFFHFDNGCAQCARQSLMIEKHDSNCPVTSMLRFNKSVMTSDKALKRALQVIKKIGPQMICPQHGCIFKGTEKAQYAIAMLEKLKGVGIDGI